MAFILKVLCYINHFFGDNPQFTGKSSVSQETDLETLRLKAGNRKLIIEKSIAELRKIEGIDIKICGISESSLIPLDLTFDKIRKNPIMLVYETLNLMGKYVNDYDYFINIEDDILLPLKTFENILEFDKQSYLNEILLPNRLETNPNGEKFCVDLFAYPGWTTQQKKYLGQTIKVALNAHSGIFIVSKAKFKYLLSHIDTSFRNIILGTGMESAFAYFHSPFSLYRSTNLNFHSISHLDHWTFSPKQEDLIQTKTSILSRLLISDFIPPIFMYIFRFLKKRIGN